MPYWLKSLFANFFSFLFGAKLQTYVSISLASLTGACHDTVQPDYALKSEQLQCISTKRKISCKKQQL